MAKPNYSHEKRKKELDRKRKQEGKQQRKNLRAESPGEDTPESEQSTTESVDTL